MVIFFKKYFQMLTMIAQIKRFGTLNATQKLQPSTKHSS